MQTKELQEQNMVAVIQYQSQLLPEYQQLVLDLQVMHTENVMFRKLNQQLMFVMVIFGMILLLLVLLVVLHWKQLIVVLMLY